MSSLFCSIPDPIATVICGGSALVGGAVGAVGNSIISSWANDFANAQAQILQVLMAGWVNLPTPSLTDSSTAIAFLQQSTAYLVGLFGVIGLMVAAARMMWLQKADPMKEALAGLLRLVVVSGCAVTAIGLLSDAGDSFSTWVLNQAVADAGQQSFPTALAAMGNLTEHGVVAASLVIVLALFSILGFLVQLVLLIVRSALLIVLAGTLPMSAAASMTPVGNQWFRKNVSWVIAFLLFKPIAAVVYGAAILAYVSSSDLMGMIIGLVLMMLATLTLPALMRFVTPLVSAVGNVSTAAAVGAVATVATGAVAIAATGGAAAPLVAAGMGSSASGVGKSAVGGDNGGGGVAGGATPTPTPSPPSGGSNGNGGGTLVGAGAGGPSSGGAPPPAP
jgi:type IV secretion system protein TrbL